MMPEGVYHLSLQNQIVLIRSWVTSLTQPGITSFRERA